MQAVALATVSELLDVVATRPQRGAQHGAHFFDRATHSISISCQRQKRVLRSIAHFLSGVNQGDAAATGEFGGTGKSIDWALMPQLQASSGRPLALAGGLTPANVGRALQVSQVNIVDVASGVESPKGVKCPDLVKQFVHQARTALNR